MKHIMVDIETAGRAPDGKIVSIGAVTFDAYDLGGRYEALIDPATAPGVVNIDTMLWWAEQAPATRQRAFSGKVTAQAALLGFNEFWRRETAEYLWAKRIWRPTMTIWLDALEAVPHRESCGVTPCTDGCCCLAHPCDCDWLERVALGLQAMAHCWADSPLADSMVLAVFAETTQ